MVLFSSVENDAFFDELKKLLNSTKNTDKLFKTIVNAPFTNKKRVTLLGLGQIVLALVNKKTKTIDRVARTNIDFGLANYRMSTKPFAGFKTPINAKGNFLAEAYKSERYQQTSDWAYLLTPNLSPQEARLNQAAAGIGCSYIYPLVNSDTGGALIFHYYLPVEKILPEHHEFMRSYSRLVSKVLG